jgi:hypothetical protein
MFPEREQVNQSITTIVAALREVNPLYEQVVSSGPAEETADNPRPAPAEDNEDDEDDDEEGEEEPSGPFCLEVAAILEEMQAAMNKRADKLKPGKKTNKLYVILHNMQDLLKNASAFILGVSFTCEFGLGEQLRTLAETAGVKDKIDEIVARAQESDKPDESAIEAEIAALFQDKDPSIRSAFETLTANMGLTKKLEALPDQCDQLKELLDKAMKPLDYEYPYDSRYL